MDQALTGLELRSLVAAEGVVRISLEAVEVGPPGPDELVVRVEAAPINPSDLGLLFGPANPETLRAAGSAEHPVLAADIPARGMAIVAARVGQSLAVGNEGAGTVVAAGENGRYLIGRRVGMIGGGMYAQFRKLPVRDCIPLPEDASAADGASMFVNPLTSLSFIETMRLEGHTAIIHTAAASNLGQMLQRICLADGIPLVNIVRSAEQAKRLRAIGASHVIDSNAPDFRTQLIEAIVATGATIGFDAIGGGKMASEILNAMETAANRDVDGYSRYGSNAPKQVYIYGALDPAPTVIKRNFGYSWNLSGWLLFPFLEKAGPETAARLRQRVVDELRTTFASHYSEVIGLAEALDPGIAIAYQRKRTGSKYLIDPTR